MLIRRPFSWRTPDKASGLFIKQACYWAGFYFKFKSMYPELASVFIKATTGLLVCIDVVVGIFVYGLKPSTIPSSATFPLQ